MQNPFLSRRRLKNARDYSTALSDSAPLAKRIIIPPSRNPISSHKGEPRHELLAKTGFPADTLNAALNGFDISDSINMPRSIAHHVLLANSTHLAIH